MSNWFEVTQQAKNHCATSPLWVNELSMCCHSVSILHHSLCHPGIQDSSLWGLSAWLDTPSAMELCSSFIHKYSSASRDNCSYVLGESKIIRGFSTAQDVSASNPPMSKGQKLFVVCSCGDTIVSLKRRVSSKWTDMEK